MVAFLVEVRDSSGKGGDFPGTGGSRSWRSRVAVPGQVETVLGQREVARDQGVDEVIVYPVN
jgi:hypothetical protein